jgi:hypothetical protein
MTFLTKRLPKPQLPKPLTAHLAKTFARRWSHSEINRLFQAHGATGDPPSGNKIGKCLEWLDHSAIDPDCDAVKLLGGLVSELLDHEPVPPPSLTGAYDDEFLQRSLDENAQVIELLHRHGLYYATGGVLTRGGTVATPTRSLEAALRGGDLDHITKEFDRAIEAAERDPGQAVTAGSAILEALFKTYIADEMLEMPAKQTIMPLWHAVRSHLGLDPPTKEDDDIKKLLGSLAAMVDGIGSFRTHAGSAHGHGRKSYRVDARMARLVIHSAHTLTLFVLETWQLRKASQS